MVSPVTLPSSSAVRVVIGGMTMRLLISTDPMRAGVRRIFIACLQCLNLTAIHVDRRAMQPAAAGRDHEGDQAGNIARHAEARDAELLAMLLAHRLLVE